MAKPRNHFDQTSCNS